MTDRDAVQRNVLPIPDRPHTGLTTFDAVDEDRHRIYKKPNHRVRYSWNLKMLHQDTLERSRHMPDVHLAGLRRIL